MKKRKVYLLFLLLISGSAIWGRCPIDISGVSKVVDTLSYRQVAPGTMYTYMSFPEYPMNVHMLTIDLRNQYNAVETFQASDHVGKTEYMTQAYERLTSQGHVPVGSINGNFWIVAGQGQPDELLGVPHSGSIHDGEMITDPNNWNRGRGTTEEELLNEIGFAAIDTDRKVWIDDMGFDGKVTIDGIGNYSISEINRIRKTNELVFFNSYLGQATRSDDDGTEVFIKPVDGQKWETNKEILCEVVRVEKNKGANTIQDGESVLSGNGKAQLFLDNLSIGQKVKVNMGIYTRTDKLRPMIQNLVTGNALVMKNGELTIRNTNEAYNSQLYPRTGIGMSQDSKTLYLIVIDGGSSRSIGANTETMCEILKASGAYNATSMDGGGSAQMMLKGHIVNNPSDGNERAVANGWMLFSTAPIDSKVARFEFSDFKLKIPANAQYKPSFLAYNQYGELLTESLEGVTLSCDASLGEIVEGEKLITSAIPQKGKLRAYYNGLEIEKEILIEESKVAFRLDSILLDNKMKYYIEVEAKSNEQQFTVDPSSLTWKIEDPKICCIDQGILTGLSNGTTLITGTLGDFKDSLKVTVEIPLTTVRSFGDFASTDWVIKSSSSIKTPFLISSNESSSLTYTYTAGRSPYVQICNDIKLYSLPTAIKIVFNPKETGLTKVVLELSVNNEDKKRLLEFTDIKKNQDNTLLVPITNLLNDVNDMACYPLMFKSLNFMIDLSTQTANQNYTIELKDFSILYSDVAQSIPVIEGSSSAFVYPNPVTDRKAFLSLSLDQPQKIVMDIYSLSGELISNVDLGLHQSGNIQLPFDGISSGIYLLKVRYGKKVEIVKIVLR